jgi:hypothetical protein
MTTFRLANSSLHLMTTQMMSLETLESSSKADSHSIPNFSVINDRAKGFDSALRTDWQCTCHSNHSVNLRLEDRTNDVPGDDSDDEDSMQTPFHVLFRYSYRAQKAPPAEMVPWSWEEADVHVTLENQLSAVDAGCGKGVRFASKAQKAVKAVLSPTQNLRPIHSLCAAISTLQQPQRDVCLSLLANEYSKQKYGVLIYPMKKAPVQTEAWTILSLRSVLLDPAFARRNRLQLAVTLASSVLQLHETPWLRDNWGMDDILFIKRAENNGYDHPFVSQRLDHANRNSSSTTSSTMSRIIRNQTLYALGLSLIELWYGKPLSVLSIAGDQAETNQMTEWNTADRLVEELYNEAGGKYSDAVRRCIRCDFDRRGSSLQDVTFQRAVYQGVVAQLQENLDFLY